MKKIAGGDLPLTARPPDDHRSSQRQQRRRQIRRRIAVGDRAADGAPVPDRRIADLRRHVGQQRRLGLQQVTVLHRVVAGQGADGDVVAAVVDVVEIG